MSVKKIVITGGSSYLGKNVTGFLLKETSAEICSVVSPRWPGNPEKESTRNLKILRADLSAPLPEKLKEALSQADRVFHFAWVRGKNLETVCLTNKNIMSRILDEMPQPSRLHFISSVAASPEALSTYGQSKYQSMLWVGTQGGVSLVCGLVIDEVPKGPYKMLVSCVKKLPVAIRFKTPVPPVYPVTMKDLCLFIRKTCETDLSPGNYRMFNDEIPLNDFLKQLEEDYGRHPPALTFSASGILKTAAFGKKTGLLPAGLSDKILTFLYKDRDFLNTFRKINSD